MKQNINGLIESNKKKSEQKEKDTLDAIEALRKDGSAINISSVSSKANVSRQYLYKRKDLLALINKYSKTGGTRKKETIETHITMLKAALRDKEKEISRLKKEIEENERYKEKYEAEKEKNNMLQNQLDTLYTNTLPTSL